MREITTLGRTSEYQQRPFGVSVRSCSSTIKSIIVSVSVSVDVDMLSRSIPSRRRCTYSSPICCVAADSTIFAAAAFAATASVHR
jgi:hypothetical protein